VISMNTIPDTSMISYCQIVLQPLRGDPYSTLVKYNKTQWCEKGRGDPQVLIINIKRYTVMSSGIGDNDAVDETLTTNKRMLKLTK